MGVFGAIRTCLFRKYAVFSGRAGRAEFWWFFLFGMLLQVGAAMFSTSVLLTRGVEEFSDVPDPAMAAMFMAPMVLSVLLLAVPTWAASARRLHDIGLSGLWAAPVFALDLASTAVFLAREALLLRLPQTDLGGITTEHALDLVVGLGLLALLLVLIRRGTRGPNRYGPDPAQTYDAETFA